MSHIKPLNGKPHDIRDLLGTSIANNISLIVLGKKFDYSDPAFLRNKRFLSEIAERSNSLNVFNFLPWLERIPGAIFLFEQLRIK